MVKCSDFDLMQCCISTQSYI